MDFQTFYDIYLIRMINFGLPNPWNLEMNPRRPFTGLPYLNVNITGRLTILILKY